MGTILSHAWRNLWRNASRTAITLSAVTLATVLLILAQGLMEGLLHGAVRNATNLSVGEAQVHAPGYLTDRSFYRSLRDPEGLAAAAHANVIAAAPRSYGYGLVARETKSAGALLWGIDPVLEQRTFDLGRHLGSGTFLPALPRRSVLLGKKLARSLDATVGSELVVVVQAADGSLGNELYTVGGILNAVGESIDRSAAILHRADFEQLFVSGGRVHELAFNTRGRLALEELAAWLEQAAVGEEVRTWRDLLPMLSDMLGMMDAALWIFASIFFLTAGLGVMNTMLMATHERIREFGVLKALGTPPWRIVRDVTAEAWLLAVVATILGTALGAALCWYLETHGIDTTGFAGETSFGGIAFDPVWRAALSVRTLVLPALTMWLVSVVAALYPAVLAARLEPVRAIEQR